MTLQERVVVTEADRQTAANIWRDYVSKIGECMVERVMLEGKLDDGLPTILAQHRIAAIEATGVVELRELFKLAVDLEAALVITGEHNPQSNVSNFMRLSSEFAALQKWFHANQYDNALTETIHKEG